MRALRRFTVTLLVGAVLLTGSVAPAVAATPRGPDDVAGSTVDAHPGYQPQRSCSPVAKVGTKALLKLLIATWGGSSSGISRSCKAGGRSEHKEGRALDWHMSVKKASQRAKVKQATTWLTGNNGEVARRLGVQYVIWNQKIWSTYYPEMGWRKLPDRGSATKNHKDHVHISLTWDGAMKQTSWWTGRAVTTPLWGACGKKKAPACRPSVPRVAQKWRSISKVEAFIPAPGPLPAIVGSPLVGTTLSVVPGTWVPADAVLTYRWYANKKAIKGATQPTFRVTKAQRKKEITVRVSATTPKRTVTKTSVWTTQVASPKK